MKIKNHVIVSKNEVTNIIRVVSILLEVCKSYQKNDSSSNVSTDYVERSIERGNDIINRLYEIENNADVKQMKELLHCFNNLTNESNGISGYYHNGHIAEWDDFYFVKETKELLYELENRGV